MMSSRDLRVVFFCSFLFCVCGERATAKPHVFETQSDDGKSAAAILEQMLSDTEGGSAGNRATQMQTNGGLQDIDDKTVREQLLRSQKHFNDASSRDLTREEKAFELDLASALDSPTALGKPNTKISSKVGANKCQPDFTKCPETFTKQGGTCEAPPEYTGPCARTLDLIGMTIEQKMAAAQICKFEFPCQDDCPQDFTVACPSMWREVDIGVCEAPATYSGDCSHFLDISSLSEEAKHTFGIECGARWPCASAAEAPAGTGLLAHSQRFASACVKDYSSPCPSGWSADGVHCRAPATYSACSPRQRFDDMSPAEKQTWENLCRASFPCVAAARGFTPTPVSFLSARTIPVDSSKIRNSLYLTQPMRTPAAAAVNVVMKENVATAFGSAKYKGMQAQIRKLTNEFEEGINKLR